MDLLMQLVVFLIVIGLVFWATQALGAAFGIPAPVVVTIQVVLVIIAVLYLLRTLTGANLPQLR